MITLGDGRFVSVAAGTIEWDVTLFRLLQGAGLSDITMHAGETPQGLAQRVHRSLMSTDAIFSILGCVLIQEGTDPFDWSPAMMAATADHIRHLRSPEDKDAISSQIVSLVAAFFRQGLLSIRISPSSSGARGAAAGSKEMTTQEAAPTVTSITANGA